MYSEIMIYLWAYYENLRNKLFDFKNLYLRIKNDH